MKTIKNLFVFAFAVLVVNTNAQEKKIKFSNGTLKICSSKNFQIEGYDGNEIIIKPLHEKRGNSFVVNGFPTTTNGSYTVNGKLAKISKSSSTTSSSNSKGNGYVLYSDDSNRKEGLKKLGKNQDNEDLGIYFTIEENNGELLFKDKNRNGLFVTAGEKYAVKVPNTLKIHWLSSTCTSNTRKADNSFVIFNNEASKIENFKGELVINSTIGNTELVDVSGPVSLNSLGGNFTIIFDKTKPSELYSVYTNNGFIDVTLPTSSSLNVKAIGKSIFSDLDFEVLSEKEINDWGHINQEMNLKLNAGKVKMNLNAGYGNVYLRKK